jgi:hypothetical protein
VTYAALFLPVSKLIVLEESGGVPALSRPAEAAQAMNNFLAD